jgi:hypothetical protein
MLKFLDSIFSRGPLAIVDGNKTNIGLILTIVGMFFPQIIPFVQPEVLAQVGALVASVGKTHDVIKSKLGK